MSSRLINQDITTPLTDEQVRHGENRQPTFRNLAVLKRVQKLELAAAEEVVEEETYAPGVFKSAFFTYSGQPTSGDTRTVGDDVYEFLDDGESVADDANIAVLIGASEDVTYGTNFLKAVNGTAPPESEDCFLTDDETPAVGRGATAAVCVVDTSNNRVTVYLSGKQGDLTKRLTAGYHDIALGADSDNATAWDITNFSEGLGGAYDPALKQAHFQIPVTDDHLEASQPLTMELNFAAAHFDFSVRDLYGYLKTNPDVRLQRTLIESNGATRLSISLNAKAFLDNNGAEVKCLPLQVKEGVTEAYFTPGGRPARVVRVGLCVDGDVAGGTLVLDVVKLPYDGGSSQVASSVSISGLTPTAEDTLTFDDDPVPVDLGYHDRLLFRLTGGSGITAPVNATINVYYVELVEAGDRIQIHAYGN